MHDGASDRDLLISKLRYVPEEGWNYHATAWIDRYGESDEIKGPGVELTQLYATAQRNYTGGRGLQVRYTRLAYPELEREEFRPLAPEQISSDHHDRLAARAWTPLAESIRINSEVGLWDDRGDSGSDAELELEWGDLFVEGSRSALAVFGSDGDFSDAAGSRVSFGRVGDDAAWDLYYELRRSRQYDFEVIDADHRPAPHRDQPAATPVRTLGRVAASRIAVVGGARLVARRFLPATQLLRNAPMQQQQPHNPARPNACLGRRLAAISVGAYLVLVACVSQVSESVQLHGWWQGLGPVLPHDSFPSDCSLCHEGSDWQSLRDDFVFDHEDQTGVALEGAHDGARCLRCHTDRGPVTVFAARGCVGCHEDIHVGQLGPSCDDCHDQRSWQPYEQVELHDHRRFPLYGIHAATACWRCHPGAEVGRFVPTDPECVSCHRSDLARTTNHVGLGWINRCDRCHFPSAWLDVELDR